MIVVDTSAVVAVLLSEPSADAILTRLGEEEFGDRVMSAASFVEAGRELAGRHADPDRAVALLEAFLTASGISVVPVDGEQARLALWARIHFGRGFGAPAKLNFGDCFSYALAKSLDAPLLFIGNDFTATDIAPALPAS